MKMTIAAISCYAATLVLAVIFIAGVRERVVNIPRWFANPPASFEIIRQQSASAVRFWLPTMALFVVTLATALITNWQNKDVRTFLLLGTACFLIVIILTATYFVKEIMAFQNMPADTPATPALLKRADTWFRTTISRNILQGIALIFFVIAALKTLR